jgi:hypothetical protein
MATDIDPKLFSRIMALPTAARRDVLGFIGSTYVDPVQLEQIVEDLTSLPVDPGKDLMVEVA